MDFYACMRGKIEAGEIGEKGRKIISRYDKAYQAALDEGKSIADAKIIADKAASEYVDDLAFRSREKIKQALILKRIAKAAEESDLPHYEAFSLYLENVMYKMDGIKNQIYRELYEIEKTIAPNFFTGNRDFTTLKEAASLMIDGKKGSGASGQAAEVLSKLQETMRLKYVAAGGRMGYVKNYFPSAHDYKKMLPQAGQTKAEAKAAWSDFVRSTHKIIDPETGKFTNDPELIDKILDKAYDRITTRGHSDFVEDIDAGLAPEFTGSRRFSEKRNYTKIFHPMDSTSFHKYNNVYGVGDEGLGDVILNNIYRMAKDVAILEDLGSQWHLSKAYMKAKIHLEDKGGLFMSVAHKKKLIDSKFDFLIGTDQDFSDDVMSNLFMATGNLVRSATLGMGGLSAIPDMAFVRNTAKIAGLDHSRLIANYVTSVAGDKTWTEAARRTGALAEAINGANYHVAREAGGLKRAGGFAQWLSAMTNTASGLARLTRVGKQVIRVEGLATLFENAHLKFNDLNDGLKTTLSRFEIKEAEWNALTREIADDASIAAGPDVNLLDLNKLRALDGDETKGLYSLANKVESWVAMLEQMAVNEGTLTSRTLTSGQYLKSKVASQTLFMFKSFPLSVLHNHTLPAIKSMRNGELDQAAHVFIYASLLGGLSLQIKNLVRGRTPEDMNTPEFFIKSALAGGGGGLLMDLILKDHATGRSKVTDALGGPMGSIVNDTVKAGQLGVIALTDAAFGEGEDFDKSFRALRRQGGRMLRRYLPGSNLWYTTLLYDRALVDIISKYTNPDYAKDRKRFERFLDERGQREFLRPGFDFRPEYITEDVMEDFEGLQGE